jgi:hypothetical protein
MFTRGEKASPGASTGLPQAVTQVIPSQHKHFYGAFKPKIDFYPVSTGLIMITITYLITYILKENSEGVER